MKRNSATDARRITPYANGQTTKKLGPIDRIPRYDRNLFTRIRVTNIGVKRRNTSVGLHNYVMGNFHAIAAQIILSADSEQTTLIILKTIFQKDTN